MCLVGIHVFSCHKCEKLVKQYIHNNINWKREKTPRLLMWVEGKKEKAALGFRMRKQGIFCRENMQLVGKSQQKKLETTPLVGSD